MRGCFESSPFPLAISAGLLRELVVLCRASLCTRVDLATDIPRAWLIKNKHLQSPKLQFRQFCELRTRQSAVRILRKDLSVIDRIRGIDWTPTRAVHIMPDRQ